MVRHLMSATTNDLRDMLAESEQAIRTITQSAPDSPVRRHLDEWLRLKSMVARELERRDHVDPPPLHTVPRLPPPSGATGVRTTTTTGH